METTTEKLDKINKTLEKHNEILQKMLELMPKPENLLTRILEFMVLLGGALSIFSIADIIRHWIIGG